MSGVYLMWSRQDRTVRERVAPGTAVGSAAGRIGVARRVEITRVVAARRVLIARRVPVERV